MRGWRIWAQPKMTEIINKAAQKTINELTIYPARLKFCEFLH